MRKQFTPRTGATLTEVLMALLIMSIGVVSVFSLFPISILSSIKANQVTNGKILADNVVEFARIEPELLRPGMHDFSHASVAPNQTWDWQGQWSAQTTYAVNDVIWPKVEPGHLFPSPNLIYRCTSGGTSGGTEPEWRLGSVSDNGVNWSPIPMTGNNQHYVVDPLGRHRDGANSRQWFGFNGTAESTSILRRTNAGFAAFTGAEEVFTLQDSWSVVFEGVPDSVSGTTVSFPSSIDLPSTPYEPPPNEPISRLILSTPSGQQSITRRLGAAINGGSSITLESSAGAGFDGSARLEVFVPRYSYIVTVRRTSPFVRPHAHVVVLFNRSYSFEDEEVYNANFAAFGNSGNGFQGVSTVAGQLSSDVLRISWDPASEPDPLLREGNYVLDARNCIWYRITDVGTESTLAGGEKQVDLILDQSVQVRTPATNSATDVGRAIFLPGIVGIYEL